MKHAYEERCILDLTRSIRKITLVSHGQALAEAKKQYQEIMDKIEEKMNDALSDDKDYIYLSKNLPDPIFKMLSKLGYRISSPYEARLNFDGETIKVSF